MGREGKNWRGLEFSELVVKRMLVSGIFKQLRTFVVVPDLIIVSRGVSSTNYDLMSKFSKIQNLFFFRGSVRCQHQLKLYSFERD